MTYHGETTIPSYILSKAYKTLNLIRRTFKSSHSPSIKTKLYMTLVCSTLSYCSPVWRPHLLTDINNLEGSETCLNRVRDFKIPRFHRIQDSKRFQKFQDFRRFQGFLGDFKDFLGFLGKLRLLIHRW